MCTNVLVLHIFIDFSHDGLTLRWSPAHILRATTTPDFEQGWWSVCVRYGLLDVAWREKDRQDGPFGPVPEQWWVVALLGLLAFWTASCPSWQKFIKFQLYLIKSYFQFWNFDSSNYLPTYQSASCIICTGCLTGENPPNSTVLSCHLCLFYWPPKSPNNIGILIIQMQKQFGLNCAWEMRQFKAFCGISFHTRCHLGSSWPYLI